MDDEGNKAESGGAASAYTRQSEEIDTPLSATVSIRSAVYLTPSSQLVVGVVRYVRGERKRGIYIPIGQAGAVAAAIARLADEHGREEG